MDVKFKSITPWGRNHATLDPNKKPYGNLVGGGNGQI